MPFRDAFSIYEDEVLTGNVLTNDSSGLVVIAVGSSTVVEPNVSFHTEHEQS